MRSRHSQGYTLIVLVAAVAVTLALFLVVPLGGGLGALREAAISFIFRKPPRFVSLEVTVEGVPQVVKAGETLKIRGGETLIVRKINANTFFDSYLGADVEGFGKANDLNEPVDTGEIRDRLIGTGIRFIPITILYLDRSIAKIPLEMELGESDFEDQLSKARDDRERIAILKSAHAAFPQNEGFLRKLSEILESRGDYASLIEIYEATLARNPLDTSLMSSLSRYYLKASRLDEALDMCRRMEAAGKADVEVYRRMAYIAGLKGDFDGRVSYLKKALEKDPANQDTVVDLAKTYEQAGHEGQAMEVYRQAAPSARDREILVPLIKEALEKKDYREAKKLLERYTSLYPQDSRAQAQLAMVLGRLGETRAQAERYERAVHLAPDNPVLWYNLAVAREKGGDAKGALDAYERVLERRKDDLDALAGAARTSLGLGRYDRARQYYSSLVKRRQDVEDLKGLAAASAAMKDHGAVIEACSSYLKKRKDHDVAVTLAQAYEARAASRDPRGRLEDLTRALDAYKTARAVNPKSAVALEKIPELSITVLKLRKSMQ